MPSVMIFGLLLAGLFCQATHGTKIWLNGHVLCRGEPLVGAKLELKESDWIDPDDILGTCKTDESGHFELKGEQDEFLHLIEAYILINHMCHDGTQRVLKGCHFCSKVPINQMPDRDDLIKNVQFDINLEAVKHTSLFCDDTEIEGHIGNNGTKTTSEWHGTTTKGWVEIDDEDDDEDDDDYK